MFQLRRSMFPGGRHSMFPGGRQPRRSLTPSRSSDPPRVSVRVLVDWRPSAWAPKGCVIRVAGMLVEWRPSTRRPSRRSPLRGDESCATAARTVRSGRACVFARTDSRMPGRGWAFSAPMACDGPCRCGTPRGELRCCMFSIRDSGRPEGARMRCSRRDGAASCSRMPRPARSTPLGAGHARGCVRVRVSDTRGVLCDERGVQSDESRKVVTERLAACPTRASPERRRSRSLSSRWLTVRRSESISRRTWPGAASASCTSRIQRTESRTASW